MIIKMKLNLNFCNMKQISLVVVFLLSQFYFSQNRKEILKVYWPTEYQWKTINDREYKGIHLTEIVPEKEKAGSWKKLGTMMYFKNTRVPNADTIIDLYREVSWEEDSKSKLTVLEKHAKGENIWVLFKEENAFGSDDKTPKSQLFYVIQGEDTLYYVFISLRKKELPEEFVEKWSKIFKNSELVYIEKNKKM